jgi:hypothetical protein
MESNHAAATVVANFWKGKDQTFFLGMLNGWDPALYCACMRYIVTLKRRKGRCNKHNHETFAYRHHKSTWY